MSEDGDSQVNFTPQALLDAGETEWPVLRELLVRRLAELAPDAVLEVASVAPAHSVQLLGWCRETGHDTFQMSADGDRTWFWIKNR